VACARNLASSPTEVKTRSGEILTITLEKNGEAIENVWMEGNTSIVYEGTLHEEAL